MFDPTALARVPEIAQGISNGLTSIDSRLESIENLLRLNAILLAKSHSDSPEAQGRLIGEAMKQVADWRNLVVGSLLQTATTDGDDEAHETFWK